MELERPANFQERLTAFDIDEAVRQKLRAIGPEIASAVKEGTRAGIRRVSNISVAAAAMLKHGLRLTDLENQHFTLLLTGDLGDASYEHACQSLVEQYSAFEITVRAHVTIASCVLRAAIAEIAPKYRFKGARLAEMTNALTAAFTYDMASIFAVYQDGALRELVSRRAAVDNAMSDFEPVIADVTGSILNAAKSLDEGSATLKDSALRTVDVVKSASQIAVESTQGMASSAQATEELHLSINEIARAVGLGSESAKHAVKNAEDAKCTLDGLVKIAAQVGSVVTVISSIAQQTNLLALNATIEAAHAGAAGRGFAVVASEVKALSARTAEATREITQQIQAMQESTLASAERMSNVIEAVTQAASTTNSIAVAIDQQRAVTKSIAETVARVAEVANRSSADLAAVSDSASRGLVTSEEIVGWSSRLAANAQSLQTNVDGFYKRIRIA
ncbi:MAG TPA: methyl-accepting chemotaxis protein [Beijerinckiaceae bacterium]|nr:methyl-accepting chemotaxis protein [Beijerinckiaceae bacterium]